MLGLGLFDIKLDWIKIKNKTDYKFAINDICFTIGVKYV